MHLNMLNMFRINLLLFYQPEICFFFYWWTMHPLLFWKFSHYLPFSGGRSFLWNSIMMIRIFQSWIIICGKADKKHPNTVYHFISIPAFRYSTLGSFPLNLCYYTKHTKPTQSTKGNNSAQKVFLKHYTHLHLWAHVNRE